MGTLTASTGPVTPFKRIAFVINTGKQGAPELGMDLLAIARNAGVDTHVVDSFPQPRGFLAGVDACCVIGGDGTLLGVAAEATRHQIPLIGVNRGTLGFLTTFSADEARAEFSDILKGRYQMAHRSLLQCSYGDGPVELALNDVVVKESVSARLLRLAVSADEELVSEYVCDGLIFSTPTGSTAYNLSAGGPLIHPAADVVALTPICPHTLSNRSIIFRPEVKLQVYNRSERASLQVSLDGQTILGGASSDPLNISLSPLRLPLIQRRAYSHFAIVRTKLGWRGRMTPECEG